MKLPTSAVMKPVLKVLAPKMDLPVLANYKKRFIAKILPGPL